MEIKTGIVVRDPEPFLARRLSCTRIEPAVACNISRHAQILQCAGVASIWSLAVDLRKFSCGLRARHQQPQYPPSRFRPASEHAIKSFIEFTEQDAPRHKAHSTNILINGQLWPYVFKILWHATDNGQKIDFLPCGHPGPRRSQHLLALQRRKFLELYVKRIPSDKSG